VVVRAASGFSELSAAEHAMVIFDNCNILEKIEDYHASNNVGVRESPTRQEMQGVAIRSYTTLPM